MFNRFLTISLCSMLAAGAAMAAPPAKFRTYRNPSNSVHIRPQPCGANICGVVVWANDKARADAAKGGTPKLIGLLLFRDVKTLRTTTPSTPAIMPSIS